MSSQGSTQGPATRRYARFLSSDSVPSACLNRPEGHRDTETQRNLDLWSLCPAPSEYAHTSQARHRDTEAQSSPAQLMSLQRSELNSDPELHLPRELRRSRDHERRRCAITA